TFARAKLKVRKRLGGIDLCSDYPRIAHQVRQRSIERPDPQVARCRQDFSPAMHDRSPDLLCAEREEHAFGATAVGGGFIALPEELPHGETEACRKVLGAESALLGSRSEWLAQ